MLVTQSNVIDVPISLATIVQIQENNAYQRSLYFKNLTTSSIAIQIETSADSGETWSLVEPSFSLAAGTIAVKEVSSLNILRIRASGGGDDRDLYVAYARMFDDSDNIWQKPLI